MNATASNAGPMRRRLASRRSGNGFTLLEMIMVLLITSMLISAVFGIVNAVTILTHDLTTSQQRESRTHAFVELCARSLRSLPADAMLRLRTRQDGGLYTTQLALADAPSPLSASAGPFTVLETEVTSEGYLRLVVRSIPEDQVLAWEMGESTVGTRLVLLENVRMLEWLVFNPTTLQWQTVWNERMPLTAMRELAKNANPGRPQGPQAPGADAPAPPPSIPQDVQEAVNALGRPQRPGLMELRFAIGNEAPQRWVFWVPARVAGGR
ncbi:prepilin-type N-terminal cleavage/methylation domain-containing protein [Roseimicrobium gellanilyticum]|uniref:Prepilin-type N-terminal cleavage/methylation domain-containing protein n=1 Tax=Roseimicrobium gellanilyticum TaxID=748857 RepID=A0A366H2R6_9BACT|nr:prepilin-type N-terminal cleavage/methylation domain-containing protein [Roseimicrobium gellanilyticum]RBP35342.1 prepilin-type N-terminal cleavage/methylation domain-containing protein [Roseimicrobium gellanilyticum]